MQRVSKWPLAAAVRMFVVSAALLSLAACGKAGETPDPRQAAAEAPTGKLVLTGSSTVAPLMLEIAKRYEALHAGVRIDVQTGGSSRGIADVRAGLADIGMVSRALTDAELGLHGTVIAGDGIGLVLHAGNPVPALSDAQVVAIYTGRFTNWKDLGGRDAPITVVNKAEGRSTLELFLQHFQLKPDQIVASVVIGDNEQGIKTLVGNPDAIGYVSLGAAEYAALHGAPIRLLPMAGVAASLDNLRNRSFPLSRPLTLVTQAPPTGLAAAFIDYARSPAVHDLIQQQSFVPAL